MGENFVFTYPGGRTANARDTATNVGSGTIVVTIEPDAGAEFEIISARVGNGEAATARAASILHHNGTVALAEIAFDGALAAQTSMFAFDIANTTAEVMITPPAPIRVRNAEFLRFQLDSAGAGVAMTYSYGIFVYGGGITITETVN